MTVRQISTLYCCATCGTPVAGVRVRRESEIVVWGPCKCDGWRREQQPSLTHLVDDLLRHGQQCLPSLEPAAELELPDPHRVPA